MFLRHFHPHRLKIAQLILPISKIPAKCIGKYNVHKSKVIKITKMSMLVAQLCLTLRPHGPKPTRLFRKWASPGKNTGVGCHFLLQGIFPTRGSNPGLLHCKQILYQLSYEGRPYKDMSVTIIKICFYLILSWHYQLGRHKHNFTRDENC